MSTRIPRSKSRRCSTVCCYFHRQSRHYRFSFTNASITAASNALRRTRYSECSTTSSTRKPRQRPVVLLWPHGTSLLGNAYAQIDRTLGLGGQIKALWVLPADTMTVKRGRNLRVWSRSRRKPAPLVLQLRAYRNSDTDGRSREWPADQIFHIPGFGFDGVKGLSRIALRSPFARLHDQRRGNGVRVLCERYAPRHGA